MNERSIYILIGLKGSGKSFIGSLTQDHFRIEFLRVESWVKELRNGRDVFDGHYLDEVFNVIESGVRQALKYSNSIVFESLGLTSQFDSMLNRLKKDFRVVLIQVKANETTCLERVKKRDHSIHINVSDDEVEKINQMASQVGLDYDYTIDNNAKTKEQLVNELTNIFN